MENKFGLVYEGALTENKLGEVNLHPVKYHANGVTIAANVYTPADYGQDLEKLYPAVTVAHPNGGVKEQVAGLFAQKLAENGFIAIAADAAYQGASSGMPRNTDDPAYRIEDISAMVDFLERFPGVDPTRIGSLGICGGGGYTIAASKTDKRIKAVATISMFNSGRVRRNGFQDSQLETIGERLRQASEARTKEKSGEKVEYIGELLTEPVKLTEEQLEQIPAGLYRDGTVYYGMTHFHPNSTSRYTTSSLLKLMAFDAEDRVELIDQPLLMIASVDADTYYMTKAVFDKATGTADKELYELHGATHIETYWKHPYVDEEGEKLVTFFGEKL
ncbi:alpha/beta hydrolase [Ligilactobacillus faecis]|uniref:alpha/beta hydrolase n=1 Tax=Ligilactobacillus faecis TaxID=762833 RepID=UPI00246888DC|nr:alpha/beta hydrolase [Ligilactobacillus faecis]WGN88806.1 alpha/beta hydrolase [Ligilactobacillus faecis]